MTTKRMTFKEWEAKGKALFGEDKGHWEFVCPSCGNVQRPADFKKYKDEGAQPDTALFSCIGRFDGHMNVDMCTKPGPCNYTSGGLLNINPVAINHPEKEDGPLLVFDFNDPPKYSQLSREQTDALERIRQWNEKYPIGTPVRRIDDLGHEHRTKTRSEATMVGGSAAVIWVEGAAGCYALERIHPDE